MNECVYELFIKTAPISLSGYVLGYENSSRSTGSQDMFCGIEVLRNGCFTGVSLCTPLRKVISVRGA